MNTTYIKYFVIKLVGNFNLTSNFRRSMLVIYNQFTNTYNVDQATFHGCKKIHLKIKLIWSTKVANILIIDPTEWSAMDPTGM